MGLEYRSGRSTTAAQLHSVAMIKKKVKQMNTDIKTLINEDTTNKPTSGDKWQSVGPLKKCVREHAGERRELFSPMNVMGLTIHECRSRALEHHCGGIQTWGSLREGKTMEGELTPESETGGSMALDSSLLSQDLGHVIDR